MTNERTPGPISLPPNWSVLARNVATYLLITVVCIAAVGFLAVRFSSDHILGQVAVSSRRTLESKTAILDERMSKVDSITYQAMYDENTFRLVWSGDSSVSNLLIMQDVIRDFQGIVRSHDWISSIYFFDSRHNYVLGDTKTDKASFPDQAILTVSKREELSVIGPRSIGGEELLSFTRSFPFFSQRLTGYVVVNVGYRTFFDTLETDDDTRFVVVNELGDIVYPSTDRPLGPDPTAVLASDPEGATITIDDTRYSVVQHRTNVVPWRVLYLQRYDDVVSAAALVRRLILVSVAGVVILASVLLWLTTRRLHEPLSAIARHARGLVGPAAKKQNEYEIVDTAIRQLLAKNLELNERYRTALPYFRKYSIEEFLHTRNWDTERFDAILSILGVHLRRSHLHVAIVESRRGADESLLRRTIETYLQSHDETLSFVAAETHTGQVALIINTDSDASTVYIVLSGLRELLRERGLSVSLAMSVQFDATAEIPAHYAEAEEQLQHRAFFGDDAVIYDFNRTPGSTSVAGIGAPTEPILDAVRSQDHEAALAALVGFAREIGVRSNGDATVVRFAFFELAMAIDRVLPASARDLSEADRRRAIYSAIHDSSHTDELTTLLEQMVTDTIRELHRVKSEHHEELVRRSVDYLEQHLSDTISVEDVAEAVFISSRYLNTIFKTHTGSTVFEYLSTMRLRRAEELLKDPSLQIQEIAALVGYGNVQSFTRLFKRHHGMTPVEYRRVIGESA